MARDPLLGVTGMVVIGKPGKPPMWVSGFRVFAPRRDHQVSMERREALVELYLVRCSCGWDPNPWGSRGWVALSGARAMEEVAGHLRDVGAPVVWVEWAEAWALMLAFGSRSFPSLKPGMVTADE